ncbi:MAG: hypothetical protein ACLPND_10485 [Candidatus Korobacteraceae bacterium]
MNRWQGCKTTEAHLLAHDHGPRGGMMKRNLAIFAVLAGVFLPGGSRLLGQDVPGRQLMRQDGVRRNATASDDSRLPDQDIQLLKKGLRSQEKQIVAANLTLTDVEAEKFWPVYDRYAQDLARINDTKVALINEYAQESDAMTDDQAKDYIQRRAAVEQSILELRVKYIPIFAKVLTGKETALFFQIEWRLGLLTDMALAQMPVVEYQ